MVKDESLIAQGLAEGDYTLVTRGMDLGTPLIVNRIDKVHVEDFLAEHADHYQVPVEYIPFDPDSDTIHISASGHRRRRALLHLAKQYDFDPERIYVQSAVYENLSFEEMLGKQFRENVSERPPRIDEAESIARYYHQKVRAGEGPTNKTIAQFYCVNEKVVSRALAFTSLPEEVKEFVRRDVLPYDLVARFQGLARAHGRLWDAREGNLADKDGQIKNELLAMAYKLADGRSAGDPVKKLDKILSAHIEAVNEKALGVQGELFMIQEAPSLERKNRAADAAAKRAIAILQLIESQGDLSDQRKAEIQALTEAAQSMADDVAPSESQLF